MKQTFRLLQSDQKEIIGKALNALFIRVFGYGFGFLFIWLLASKLGPEVQGVFAIAFLFLSIGSMIGKVGFSTAIVKWVANELVEENKRLVIRKTTISVLLSSLVIAVGIALSAPLITDLQQKPSALISMYIAAATIPALSVLDVCSSVFRGLKETTTFSLYFDFLKFLLPLLCFVVLYFVLGYQYTEVPMWSYFIGHYILVVILLIHLNQRFRIFSKIQLFGGLLATKSMVTESIPMLVASSIVMIMGWSDIFILSFYVAEEDVGIYSTSVRIATLVSFTYTAIAAISTPKIAEYYHSGTQDKLVSTINFSATLMFLCGLPIFLLLICFPEFFLNFFGEEYKKGAVVLQILLLAQLGNIITGPVGPIFQMTGLEKKLQLFILISLLVNILVSITLISILGMEGVAIGSAIGMVSWNVLGARYLYYKRGLITWPNLNRFK